MASFVQHRGVLLVLATIGFPVASAAQPATQPKDAGVTSSPAANQAAYVPLARRGPQTLPSMPRLEWLALQPVFPQFLAEESRVEPGRPYLQAARWKLRSGSDEAAGTTVDLRQGRLTTLGDVGNRFDDLNLAPLHRPVASVHGRRQGHWRWASVSLQQSFRAARLEFGFEGLSSEPMAAQVRRGRSLVPLRRAGTVLGARFGSLNQQSGVFVLDPLGQAGQRSHARRGRRIWRRAERWAVGGSMLVDGHARRWLGHGQRPHFDARWQVEGMLTLAQADGERLAQLLARSTWRQVVGPRGQVVQAGSIPGAGSDAPYILYEPLVGFEDLARYTAHVFATEAKLEARLLPWLACGLFASATLVDRFSQEWRDSWLTAAGPCLSARLPFGSEGLMVSVQSARRAGNEHDRWLHLVTLGA